MSTEQQRAEWRELAASALLLGRDRHASAITALLADVDAAEARADALAAELATVRAQVARFEEIERYYQDRNNVIAETGSGRNSQQ